MSTIPTFKAGWLLRQSSVLKRWKKNWFVLYGDGNLSFYEDESRKEKHGNFNITAECAAINTALECNVDPPDHRNFGCLMKLISRHNNNLVLCAANSDEALSWKMMVEQMIRIRTGGNTNLRRWNSYPSVHRANYPIQRNTPVYCYPNYGPVQVWYNEYGQPYYVHPQTQVVTVIRERDPYYYRNGDLMWGVAAGAMLGAALYTPFLFF
uniref:Pleckstrin homology domain-containing family B member 2 n=1 Tax=Ciona intestinalis TaxID=7719 RepID=F6X0T1_CIOIN|nr:pleckstrin homology domain-containing family B member 2 [Ciona intestinalis]|eukprot:XP_002121756.1 pleckstrin homology domain-containing family B member 2 [Ciona intestinalis]